MTRIVCYLGALFVSFGVITAELQARENPEQPAIMTESAQKSVTPISALRMMKDGNKRFLAGTLRKQDTKEALTVTAPHQYPFASVLSCIDARVPVEQIFDQKIGVMCVARVAGNMANEDILGSLEYASKAAGSRLIVVLGHTACGAVKGAYENAELGNLTGLLNKIKPAIEVAKADKRKTSLPFKDSIAQSNVGVVIDNIRTNSPVLAEMEKAGSIKIVGAMYDVQTGTVTWFE